MAVTWPRGFASAGASCGIKAAGPDLGILLMSRPRAWAGAFTTNAAAAAPVRWSRARLGSPARAIVVNSGNANACTGAAGEAAVEATARAAAATLGCDPTEVLVASTGPIGVRLPESLIANALPALWAGATPQVEPFATAILTTDTQSKTAAASCGSGSVVGVAKGAAMVAPNMATMLAFIATDLEVDAARCEVAVRDAVQRTFNRISVDACESTNDSVFLLTSGEAGPAGDGFEAALQHVCASLAEQIVRDAEGGSRFVRVKVSGAESEQHAVDLGRAVAASALWRAAMNGGDPNWGRVLAALGTADRSLDLDLVEVAIGSEVVFGSGQPSGSLDVAAKVMAEPEYEVRCRVGTGSGAAEVLTADLSCDYVRLNAEGTS